jgi:hypothetical protein
MSVSDGCFQLDDGVGDVINLAIPEYGYKSIIELPFDIDTLDTGIKVIWAYDITMDKYRCECDLILNATDMTACNNFMKVATEGRAKNNITMTIDSNSAFYPFTPMHSNVGPWTVGIVITKCEKLQDNPFRYFKVSIAIYTSVYMGSFPFFVLPTQINEGSLSIAGVNNIRFPTSYFDSDEDNAILHNVSENGVLNFIDRGILAASWRTTMNLSCGTGVTANLIWMLVNTIRNGTFTLTTQPYQYAFGNDKGSSSSYTVSMIQDKIEIVHSAFNKFEFPLTVQYLAG